MQQHSLVTFLQLNVFEFFSLFLKTHLLTIESHFRKKFASNLQYINKEGSVLLSLTGYSLASNS